MAEIQILKFQIMRSATNRYRVLMNNKEACAPCTRDSLLDMLESAKEDTFLEGCIGQYVDWNEVIAGLMIGDAINVVCLHEEHKEKKSTQPDEPILNLVSTFELNPVLRIQRN